MSDTTGKQVPPGMQAILAAGQAMAQGFFDALARQHVAMQDSSGVAAQKLPMPETEVMASLQKVFAEKHAELWSSMLARTPGAAGPAVVQPEPGDKRFAAPEWSESPVFDYMRQAYLLNAGFLRQMADAMPIADGRAKARMQFLTRQYIDALSPSNFAATNPEFIKTAVETKGESIARGIQNLLGDLEKGRISMTDDAAFEIGRNLALTPGSVVYENELMQLIQYAPLTEKVAQTPLLIVPPCINKFYIMDLQPENSLVRFVVEQGFTVFLVSWKNPRPDTGGHYTWDDYLDKGPLAALEVVRSITRVKKPNVLGFCVGGTILTSALAVARARGEEPVASLTLMTTLLDFSDAGELGCLVDEASVTAREAAIGKGGVLKGQELANVFGRQLPQGQQAGRLRPAVLELRFDQPAGALPHLVPAQHVPREQPARAGQAQDARAQGRPRQGRRAGLPDGGARGPHRAVEERLPGAQRAGRRHHLRARRKRPHRRRDQPGFEESPQLLDRRCAPGRPRRMVRERGRAQGQLVAALGRVAARPWRQGGGRARTPGQHEVRADRAGAGALRQGAFLTRNEEVFSVRRQRIGRSLPSCSRSVQHYESTPHRERRRRWQELHW